MHHLSTKRGLVPLGPCPPTLSRSLGTTCDVLLDGCGPPPGRPVSSRGTEHQTTDPDPCRGGVPCCGRCQDLGLSDLLRPSEDEAKTRDEAPVRSRTKGTVLQSEEERSTMRSELGLRSVSLESKSSPGPTCQTAPRHLGHRTPRCEKQRGGCLFPTQPAGLRHLSASWWLGHRDCLCQRGVAWRPA